MKGERLWILALGAMLSVSPVLAGVLQFDEATGARFGSNSQNLSIGWQFDVTSPVTVVGLEYYDYQQNGLNEAHLVKIWDPAGSEVLAGTVPAGTVGHLDGVFRMVAVNPTLLLPGSGYIVAAFMGDTSLDLYADTRVGQEIQITYLHPGISFRVGMAVVSGPDLQRPTTPSILNPGIFGGSFAVQTTPGIPEPSTWLLVGLGALGLLACRRRHAS